MLSTRRLPCRLAAPAFLVPAAGGNVVIAAGGSVLVFSPGSGGVQIASLPGDEGDMVGPPSLGACALLVARSSGVVRMVDFDGARLGTEARLVHDFGTALSHAAASAPDAAALVVAGPFVGPTRVRANSKPEPLPFDLARWTSLSHRRVACGNAVLDFSPSGADVKLARDVEHIVELGEDAFACVTADGFAHFVNPRDSQQQHQVSVQMPHDVAQVSGLPLRDELLVVTLQGQVLVVSATSPPRRIAFASRIIAACWGDSQGSVVSLSDNGVLAIRGPPEDAACDLSHALQALERFARAQDVLDAAQERVEARLKSAASALSMAWSGSPELAALPKVYHRVERDAAADLTRRGSFAQNQPLKPGSGIAPVSSFESVMCPVGDSSAVVVLQRSHEDLLTRRPPTPWPGPRSLPLAQRPCSTLMRIRFLAHILDRTGAKSASELLCKWTAWPCHATGPGRAAAHGGEARIQIEFDDSDGVAVWVFAPNALVLAMARAAVLRRVVEFHRHGAQPARRGKKAATEGSRAVLRARDGLFALPTDVTLLSTRALEVAALALQAWLAAREAGG